MDSILSDSPYPGVLRQDAMSGQPMGVDPLLAFLKPWLKEHVMQADRRFVPFLKETR